MKRSEKNCTLDKKAGVIRKEDAYGNKQEDPEGDEKQAYY